MPTPTPNQLKRMLLAVNQQIAVETQVHLDAPSQGVPARLADLKRLKARLETAIALAAKQSAPTTSEGAPPSVTIH